MSGLAAASRLATLGHRVTVCEAGGTYGGMVGRYERDGFAFDTGPGLLTLPAVYRDLALKTGKEPLEQLVDLAPVDPESRHLFPDGTDLALPNASRGGVGQALDAAFGTGSGALWNAVVNRGRTVWEATRRPLLEEPLPADPRPLHADPYPVPPRRGLARLRPAGRWTLADVAARELGGHPGLTALLHEHALRFGFDPRTAPAGATVLPYMEQSFGVWYVRGGLRALADAVYRRCEQRRVEFRFDTRFEQVVERDGRACGIDTSAGSIEADVVISAVGAPAQDRTDPVPGRVVVLLALRGERPAGTVHRTVVHAADPAAELAGIFTWGAPLADRPTVQVLRPDDPSLHPAGHETAVLTATAPAGGVDWTEPGAADRFADRMIAHADAAGLGLADRALWRVVRTPADTERESGSPFGAVPRPALAGDRGAYLQAPTEQAPGHYRIGGAAHPGGGLARVGMSACIAANLIGPA
ncbi:NAD(P)/FAD-dependent oxidoreductase [Streptomyces kaniharaensis]|uniref:NAD(P)/FAD-dependent oxidoreductase n=2 Tax=Streptomyces kaniharaensis TaxID=212423 RepID=A0A6N7KQI3_9ACTN|nr:NAD(P)/FAD-dependent oxidoreductase [Streptomyces kaniharaensis]